MLKMPLPFYAMKALRSAWQFVLRCVAYVLRLIFVKTPVWILSLIGRLFALLLGLLRSAIFVVWSAVRGRMPIKRSAFDELMDRLKANEEAYAKVSEKLKESDSAKNALECQLNQSKQELAHTKQAYESACAKSCDLEERCVILQTALQAAKQRNERGNHKF